MGGTRGSERETEEEEGDEANQPSVLSIYILLQIKLPAQAPLSPLLYFIITKKKKKKQGRKSVSYDRQWK